MGRERGFDPEISNTLDNSLHLMYKTIQDSRHTQTHRQPGRLVDVWQQSVPPVPSGLALPIASLVHMHHGVGQRVVLLLEPDGRVRRFLLQFSSLFVITRGGSFCSLSGCRLSLSPLDSLLLLQPYLTREEGGRVPCSATSQTSHCQTFSVLAPSKSPSSIFRWSGRSRESVDATPSSSSFNELVNPSKPYTTSLPGLVRNTHAHEVSEGLKVILAHGGGMAVHNAEGGSVTALFPSPVITFAHSTCWSQ